MPRQIAHDRSLRSIDSQNGHMRVEQSYISKANICEYLGREIPGADRLGLDPQKRYRLLRSPEELMRAADSFSHLPLLIKHVAISADQPEQALWVGTTGKVTFEHPYLVSRPLMVWTQEAIDLIDTDRQKELSSAYGYDAEMTPGLYEGTKPYDGIMRNLRGNHVAIVVEGRVGPDVCVADESPPEFRNMRAAAVAKLIKPFLAQDADMRALAVALDAESDKEEKDREKAKDALEEHYGMSEEEWEALTPEERQAARDSWKDSKGKDAKAKDAKAKDKAARDAKAAKDARAAKDAGGEPKDNFESSKDSAISKDELTTALDAAIELAVKRTNDLHIAREAVKPLVGIVAMDSKAMDSAEKIYRFALKQAGIKDADKLHVDALAPMVDVIKSSRSTRPRIAQDAAGHRGSVSIDSIWKAE